MSKILINTKDTEFEQNRKKYAIIDTSFRDGKPIMLDEVDIETVEPNLQTKEVTITSNTSTIISPDVSYDGLSNVTVITNVPSAPSTLEYEEGTFTPTNDTQNPSISFTNTHTTTPSLIIMEETNQDVNDADSVAYWSYTDIEKTAGYFFKIQASSTFQQLIYGNVYCLAQKTSTTMGSLSNFFNYSSSDTGASTKSYPRYFVNENGFTPYTNFMTSYNTPKWVANHTYKWKAYWL